MGIFAWVGFGVLVAVVAKLLTPRRLRANWGVYLCYGVAGGVVGGWIAARIDGVGEFFHPGYASSVGSIIGAAALLWVPRLRAARQQPASLHPLYEERNRQTRKAA